MGTHPGSSVVVDYLPDDTLELLPRDSLVRMQSVGGIRTLVTMRRHSDTLCDVKNSLSHCAPAYKAHSRKHAIQKSRVMGFSSVARYGSDAGA